MKNNKHPHHDLIVEWAKDTSKAVQLKSDDSWCDARMPNWDTDKEYRIKPREFIKGHWYPCLRHELEFICKFNGHSFVVAGRSGYKENEITIGESLGEIKFGSGK